MRLISATDEFVISGMPYAGFPILLWDNMESCQPANQFLRYYLLRGAIGSDKSWAATGRALYDYFSFLQAHDLSWDDVDRDETTLVHAYRDYCFKVANLAPTTVRNRLLYVCEFYTYALDMHWIGKLPFGYETRNAMPNGGFLSHVSTRGRTREVPDVMPRVEKPLPEFLEAVQVGALLEAATNVHHHMIIRLALGSGLRKEELATFPRAYVYDPDLAGRSERNIRIRLDPRDGNGMKTKGAKRRDIFISRTLMKDLNHYAIHHRGTRASLSDERQHPLFLNQFGRPFSADGKSLDRIVRLVGRKAGLQVWTHLLRHTYATNTLAALQRRRDANRIEPLVFLQRQLGHASINTTMIYLHLINSLAEEAVLAYDDELIGSDEET